MAAVRSTGAWRRRPGQDAVRRGGLALELVLEQVAERAEALAPLAAGRGLHPLLGLGPLLGRLGLGLREADAAALVDLQHQALQLVARLEGAAQVGAARRAGLGRRHQA